MKIKKETWRLNLKALPHTFKSFLFFYLMVCFVVIGNSTSIGTSPTAAIDNNKWWFLVGGILGMIAVIYMFFTPFHDKAIKLIYAGELFLLSGIFFILFTLGYWDQSHAAMYTLAFFFLIISVIQAAYVFAATN